MYLAETLDSINYNLAANFGKDIVTGLPNWRVVWSEDQFERRLGTYDDYTPNGVYLRTVREVREVPKYRQWIKEKYVLERLTVIPAINLDDLPVGPLSYEPIYPFEDKHGNALPPKWLACQFLIKHMLERMNTSGSARYKEEIVGDEIRLKQLEEELFGNETPVGDALAHGSGVSLVGPRKEN